MRILFEDDAVIVVAKPSGQVVHPAPGHETGALTDEILRHCPSVAGVGSVERPGVVHRLDIETSGVMVFAKTQPAYRELRRQFEEHRAVRKTYLAVCHGTFSPQRGTWNTPVGRERLSATTHYEVLGRKGAVSLVKFDIETGRTHQIRIHSSEAGHPIAGDSLYGDKRKDASMQRRPKRLLLHAVELSFLHPVTRRRMTFADPPPPDIVYAV